MNKKYYMLEQNGKQANLSIYGDITSCPWFENDVSAFSLVSKLETLDAEEINVYINSYGGEVAEGLAIYNALKRHKAKINTFCDGFACSIASVIFMAGDERMMSPASLLMIHNAWTCASGNAQELRKQADDLEIITSASVAAYTERVSITENEVKELMDAETWIDAKIALQKGFATKIIDGQGENPSQHLQNRIFEALTAKGEKKEKKEPEPKEPQKEKNKFINFFENY